MSTEMISYVCCIHKYQNYVLLAIHHDVSNPYKEKQNNNCTNDVREPEKNNPIKQKFCHQFPFYRETFGQRPILTKIIFFPFGIWYLPIKSYPLKVVATDPK